MSVLPEAGWAGTKHTSIYLQSGDSVNDNIGNLIFFTILVFLVIQKKFFFPRRHCSVGIAVC